MTIVHFLCALAAHFGWDVHQSDIVTAFLNGDIFEEVYVMQPRDFVKIGQEDKSNRKHIIVKRQGDVLLVVVLYVDDLLIAGQNERHIVEFKADLNATFKMKDLGLLHHYLGIQIKQCDGGIALCRKSYIESLLCKFGLEDCKPIATPMKIGLKLSLHDVGDLADVTLYQTVVGCLIYVCNTRPDIQFAVSQISRFKHSPGSKHWQAIKRIFCYLIGTLVVLTRECPQVVFVSCLAVHVYHG
ncbi:hypothetical protein L7F22_058453 [Adiantum nelumboides]|nr:hypothetical protein [Adiantum nelumboides]